MGASIESFKSGSRTYRFLAPTQIDEYALFVHEHNKGATRQRDEFHNMNQTLRADVYFTDREPAEVVCECGRQFTCKNGPGFGTFFDNHVHRLHRDQCEAKRVPFVPSWCGCGYMFYAEAGLVEHREETGHYPSEYGGIEAGVIWGYH